MLVLRLGSPILTHHDRALGPLCICHMQKFSSEMFMLSQCLSPLFVLYSLSDVLSETSHFPSKDNVT